MEKIDTTIALNYNMFKERCEDAEKTIKKIAKASLKLIPREMLIKILKQRKIIETDWEKRTNKYKLKKL